MSRDDTRDTGIPTRAIHEAYLTMQQAHREYRQVRDRQGHDETRAHAEYQDAVLTFYELIRPHLKRKSGLRRFWQGELPEYPDRWWSDADRAIEYCTRYGTAVWDLQQHVHTTATSPNASGGATALADGGERTPREWHDELGLTDMQRIAGLGREEDAMVWVELRAVAGLKQLDSWDTRQRKRRERGDGFMASETATAVELEYVPVWKLTTGKRLLAEAADKMNLLSRVDIDQDDGAIVNFDQSRDGAKAEYRDVEYDGSPDI